MFSLRGWHIGWAIGLVVALAVSGGIDALAHPSDLVAFFVGFACGLGFCTAGIALGERYL
jgi:hypothetical protein